MTAWILLIFVAGTNSMTSQQIEIKSRTACELAAVQSREELAKLPRGLGQALVVAYCVERLP